METRRIGTLEVSLVGLGCNNFGMRCDEQQSTAVVHAALDAGITLFDTADIYGGTRSEEFLGRALGSRRDEVVVATKFGMQIGDDPQKVGASRRWITQAAEDSLRRLGTDRIDLYQQHAPDAEVPIDETLQALDDLVSAGKVLEIGNSNFSADQLGEADESSARLGTARFVSAQNELSLLRRGALHEVVPACDRLGLGLLPYFPLASGLLTGKYQRGEPPPPGTRLASMGDPAKSLSDERFDRVDALAAVAEERDHTLLELAMAWLAAQPAMASVIAGATKPEQVSANVAAVAWRLDKDDLAAVDDALERTSSKR